MLTDEQKENRIGFLEGALRGASEAYYGEGSSILTDEEFDNYVDELRNLNPENSFLKEIGAKVSSVVWPKAQHQISMGSLEKVRDKNELNSWWEAREWELEGNKGVG